MTPKSHPILFSASMIRSILDGRKSMTRRVVKFPHVVPFLQAGHHLTTLAAFPASNKGWIFFSSPAHLITEKMKMGEGILCPYGQPGDVLWVREAWGYAREADSHTGKFMPRYKATHEESEVIKWHPAIYLRQIDSRITLEITAVRVERLQDITEENAIAEGITGPHDVGYPAFKIPGDSKPRYSRAAAAFEDLWDSLHAKDGFDWKANPWCWCISFRRVKP